MVARGCGKGGNGEILNGDRASVVQDGKSSRGWSHHNVTALNGAELST